MDLTPYVNDLRNDLLATAAVGTEEVRRTAAVLATSVESAARLAIMHALSDLAAEITGRLPEGSVDLRLDGREVRVTVSGLPTAGTGDAAGHTSASATATSWAQRFGWTKSGPAGGGTHVGGTTAADGTAATDAGDPDGHLSTPEELRRAVQDAGGELSRTTVRLFNELKSQAERAAADQGVSLNTYISRAVSDSVRSSVPGRRPDRPDGAQGNTVTGHVHS
ncbi:toxin-antitoxin system HicB family antitoxin [Nakamurella sp. YIM 132084]|uniref:Toxin-antitoxin system HicB family antitoxin n=2 Tax=Nakamurella leprariae TaxID=2803911 RepID=A0A938YFB3_9ACTN|nr:toxin-antitoxin system HicB family antitoxin [Nakamurella leprariae]